MLRDLALEHGLYLIADEVYRECVYDGQRHTSLFHLDGLEDRGILIDSVSKRFSACGARIGCIISRSRELNDIVLRFGQARLCPPTVDQIAARAALATPPSYLDDVRTEYEKRRDVLVGALQKIPGVGCTTPAGAFYLMAQLPVEDADDFCQWILREFELDGKSVMMAPGDGFYVSPGGGKREVRIAYVLRSEGARTWSMPLECWPRRWRPTPARRGRNGGATYAAFLAASSSAAPPGVPPTGPSTNSTDLNAALYAARSFWTSSVSLRTFIRYPCRLASTARHRVAVRPAMRAITTQISAGRLVEAMSRGSARCPGHLTLPAVLQFCHD
jgi:hypothetical protein